MTKAASKQSDKTPRKLQRNLKQRKQKTPEPAKPARGNPGARREKPGRADRSNSISSGSRSNTKQARVIAMLRAPAGCTIGAMMRATGWQQHSVRGFLAGVVCKKLRLYLVSEASESGRVYRVVDTPAPAADAA